MARLLENGDDRLLESGDVRLLESDGGAASSIAAIAMFYRNVWLWAILLLCLSI